MTPRPDIDQIEQQLKLRVETYRPTSWGRKQSNVWDHQTKFIYHTPLWHDLLQTIKPLTSPLADYAVNRWFNFWSARAVEQIFCALPEVIPHTNQYDRLVDFSIRGINFDHKTSVYPAQYEHSLDLALKRKSHLIWWLYQNQSGEQRYHTANRLFIILYAYDGEHWKLRAEISALRDIIEQYVISFKPARLIWLALDSKKVASDIIWFVK